VLTAPQQVASAIRREILEGALKPGDKLPSEQAMAELFGVSRPTVRAGLQELCAARILAVKRGRNGGYEVGDFSLDTLEASVTEFISLSLVVETLTPEQFLEVRFAQELLCAETAARHRTARSVARLEEVAARIEQASTEPRRAFELDLEFHRILAEATENPLLLSFEGAMIAVLHRLVGGGGTVSPADALGNVQDIIAAVREGDPERARESMRLHLDLSVSHHYLRAELRSGREPRQTAGARPTTL
jgi:GntR family transcriptional repressor for pyruvate dehydrogenase complex